MRFPFFVSALLLAVLLQSSEGREVSPTPETRPADIVDNDGKIQRVTEFWISDQPTATIKHGNIMDWDTSDATNMAKLFLDHPDFNDDISKWDVASVTTTR